MAQLKITQVKSDIGGTAAQRTTLRSTGLKRTGHSVTKESSPQLRGMIRTVIHLIDVEEV